MQLDSSTQAVSPDLSLPLLSVCWPHSHVLVTGFLCVGSEEMGGKGWSMAHGARKGDGGETCLSQSQYIKSQLNVLLVAAQIRSQGSEGQAP